MNKKIILEGFFFFLGHMTRKRNEKISGFIV